MPLRDRIVWAGEGTFSDSRLANFPQLIRDFRCGNYHGWHTKTFENREEGLPRKPYAYYREHYVGPQNVSGSLRIVLGTGGEIYVSGNHYLDFRQVVGVPGI
jgi:guanyl-specific ribonuclease Sa